MEFPIFFIILSVGSFVLAIVILLKFWHMANDIKELKQKLVGSNRDLAYLVAIGEKAQAEKQLLVNLMDSLYYIYSNPNLFTQKEYVDNMKEKISYTIEQAKLIDYQLPDYLQSPKAFVDYMNKFKAVTREEKLAESDN